MPDPLVVHERKMHSKTYTKSPRVWKVYCCFLSRSPPPLRGSTTAATSFELFAGFYNMQAECSSVLAAAQHSC